MAAVKSVLYTCPVSLVCSNRWQLLSLLVLHNLDNFREYWSAILLICVLLTFVVITVVKIFFSENDGHIHTIYSHPPNITPPNSNVSLISVSVVIYWEVLEKRLNQAQETISRRKGLCYKPRRMIRFLIKVIKGKEIWLGKHSDHLFFPLCAIQMEKTSLSALAVGTSVIPIRAPGHSHWFRDWPMTQSDPLRCWNETLSRATEEEAGTVC